MELSIADIGRGLMSAGRLRARPLCVYGTESVPEGAVQIGRIDRCVAKAMLMLALDGGRAAYLGEGTLEGCCPGGIGWLGYAGFSKGLKYFVSTGDKRSMGGAAEHLKRSPDLVEASLARIGPIERLGRLTVIEPGGATCATLVTYPAGLAANSPMDAVFVGPVDPTGNACFPE
jgi:hypothetical protein